MIPSIANPTELVGAMPLHLACARPLCRLKAPLGLSLLRKRELALAGGTGSSHRQQRKTGRSDGERPVVHIAIVCGSWQGASGWRTSCFCSQEKPQAKLVEEWSRSVDTVEKEPPFAIIRSG